MRLRAYRIECDECAECIDTGHHKDAEDQARSRGWALLTGPGRTKDYCRKCRGREKDGTDD